MMDICSVPATRAALAAAAASALLGGCIAFYDDALPEVEASDAGDSDTATPDTTNVSDTAMPDTTERDTALPDTVMPDAVMPDAVDDAVDATDADDADAADADAGPTVERVSESIIVDTRWTADRVYVLEEVIYVEGAARLTIEAGTTIRGEEGSALVVTRDATIEARGQRDAPIVFTSAMPVGERDRKDWGGLVLLGNAPVNLVDARIEGVPEGDSRGNFGGGDEFSNCGVLEYVRVEFAGFEAYANNELNGLTLGGCGRNTIVRNVQVHMTFDDGVECFGGNVDLQNIVITRAGDDGLDWDLGWTGRVQFLVVQQEGGDGDNAIEADNYEFGMDNLPRSNPTLYNVTLIGSRNLDVAQRGMTIRHGTAGTLRNFIVSGFTFEAVDVQDPETTANIDTGDLSMESMILYDIGPGGDAWFQDETDPDPSDDDDGPNDDGGFVELEYFSAEERSVSLGVDPMLPEDAFDILAPNWVPDGDSPARMGAAPVPQAEFWNQGATYFGAVRPGTSNPWWSGWTAFPPN